MCVGVCVCVIVCVQINNVMDDRYMLLTVQYILS